MGFIFVGVFRVVLYISLHLSLSPKIKEEKREEEKKRKGNEYIPCQDFS
jgi:hypothetical protein